MGFDEDTGSPLFQRKSPVDLNTKIMIAAIISVTTVIFVLTLLHLYTRSVLSRQDHRRRTAILRLLLASAASSPTPKTGLHPSVVAALPASTFTTAEGNETVIECSVCLSVVQEGETVRTLPNCHHTFHAECIDKWFGGRSSCPIFRAEAAPRHPMLLTPEPRGRGAVSRGGDMDES
ncbi:hypothetical protein DM860_008854 [Cuscuta australis]|uniref:RING-type domain-containing protein n=1 Tax=Cuscuta australis TaxID=267555 RepID=A0A328D754_9ASTE|nr:hypothetical protein DM860_008854 [Cuscuta australis]